MLRASVAQNPTIAVSDGTNTTQELAGGREPARLCEERAEAARPAHGPGEQRQAGQDQERCGVRLERLDRVAAAHDDAHVPEPEER